MWVFLGGQRRQKTTRFENKRDERRRRGWRCGRADAVCARVSGAGALPIDWELKKTCDCAPGDRPILL